jgi:hypothetical protein
VVPDVSRAVDGALCRAIGGACVVVTRLLDD